MNRTRRRKNQKPPVMDSTLSQILTMLAIVVCMIIAAVDELEPIDKPAKKICCALDHPQVAAESP